MTDPADIPAVPPALPPSYGRVTLGVVMSAREANLLGNIHGGEIVKLALARTEEIEAGRGRP